MMKEKGFAAYAALGHVSDDLVMDALLPEDRGSVVAYEKKKSRFSFDFFSHGWGLAMVCTLVAIGVMGGIIWAGNRPGSIDPPGGTVGSDTEIVETGECLPFPEPSYTLMMVWSGGIGCEPLRFSVWSEDHYEGADGLGHAVTADGVGFLTSMQYGYDEGLVLPQASLVREFASRDDVIYGISLDPDYELQQVTVYDMALNVILDEPITESWENWDYAGRMKDLQPGKYYVSFYVSHSVSSGGMTHRCGQDFAFVLSVTDTAEITSDCTIRTEKDAYNWGEHHAIRAYITASQPDAWLSFTWDDWALEDVSTGVKTAISGKRDFSLAPPDPDTGTAVVSCTFYLNEVIQKPGAYRLIYMDTIFCDFVVDAVADGDPDGIWGDGCCSVAETEAPTEEPAVIPMTEEPYTP